jgi:hypothetical protein
MFQSTQTCHPEARRAEGTGPKPPYVRNHRFLRPCGPQDDRSGKIRGDYVFTSNRNHTQLIYDYFDVDADTVRETATKDIPDLVPEIKIILDQLNQNLNKK